MLEVQNKLVLGCVLSFVFSIPSAYAYVKVWSCGARLSAKMKDVKESEKNFHAYVEEKAKNIKNSLRSSPSYSVAPGDALVAIRRAFSSEEEFSTSHFKFPHRLPDFSWNSQKQNVARLQSFFHDQVDYTDLRSADFEVVIKTPQGPLHPVFFENIVKQVFELNTERLEYALSAYSVFKETRAKDKNYYPVTLKELSREMALEFAELSRRMPMMSAMALQLFRLNQAEATGSSVDLALLAPDAFDVFLERDASYRLLLHGYLKLREALNQFTQDVDIQRQIFELQRESTP